MEQIGGDAPCRLAILDGDKGRMTASVERGVEEGEILSSPGYDSGWTGCSSCTGGMNAGQNPARQALQGTARARPPADWGC